MKLTDSPVTGEAYSAQLIRRKDGKLIDETARRYLLEGNYHFDESLGGFVTEDGGLPWSFSVFLPAHELEVVPVELPYDVQWFSPRSPDPVFEALPTEWDGFPPNGLITLFFLTPTQNEGKPFIAWWQDGTWGAPDERRLGPADVLAGNWTVLSTLSEATQMTYTLIDEAREKRLSRSEVNRIATDLDTAALWVGVKTGRIASFESRH